MMQDPINGNPQAQQGGTQNPVLPYLPGINSAPPTQQQIASQPQTPQAPDEDPVLVTIKGKLRSELVDTDQYQSMPPEQRQRVLQRFFLENHAPHFTQAYDGVTYRQLEELSNKFVSAYINYARPQQQQTTTTPTQPGQQQPMLGLTSSMPQVPQVPQSQQIQISEADREFLNRIGASDAVRAQFQQTLVNAAATDQQQQNNPQRIEFNRMVQSNPDMQNFVEQQRQKLKMYNESHGDRRSTMFNIGLDNADAFEIMQMTSQHENRNNIQQTPSPAQTRTERALNSVTKVKQASTQNMSAPQMPGMFGDLVTGAAGVMGFQGVGNQERRLVDPDRFLTSYFGGLPSSVLLTRITPSMVSQAGMRSAGLSEPGGGASDPARFTRMSRQELYQMMIDEAAMNPAYTERLVRGGSSIDAEGLRMADPELFEEIAYDWISKNLDSNYSLTSDSPTTTLNMSPTQAAQTTTDVLGDRFLSNVRSSVESQALARERAVSNMSGNIMPGAGTLYELGGSLQRFQANFNNAVATSLLDTGQGILNIGAASIDAIDNAARGLVEVATGSTIRDTYTPDPYRGVFSEYIQRAKRSVQGMSDLQLSALGGQANADFLNTELPAGLGQVSTLIATSMLGGNAISRLGLATEGIAGQTIGMFMGSAQNASGVYDEAIANGATTREALGLMLPAAGIGVLDALPILKFLDTAGKIPGVANFMGSLSGTTIGGMLANGIEEGTMEMLQNALNHATIDEMLDLSRDLDINQMVNEGAVGFVVGALLGAMNGKKQTATPEQVNALNNEIRRVQQLAFDQDVVVGGSSLDQLMHTTRRAMQDAAPGLAVSEEDVIREVKNLTHRNIVSQVVSGSMPDPEQEARDIELRNQMRESSARYRVTTQTLQDVGNRVLQEREEAIAKTRGQTVEDFRKSAGSDRMSALAYQTMIADLYSRIEPNKYAKQLDELKGLESLAFEQYNQMRTMLGRQQQTAPAQPEPSVADVAQSIDNNGQTEQPAVNLVDPIFTEDEAGITSSEPERVASALRRSPAFSALDGDALSPSSPMGEIVAGVIKTPATERRAYIEDIVNRAKPEQAIPQDSQPAVPDLVQQVEPTQQADQTLGQTVEQQAPATEEPPKQKRSRRKKPSASVALNPDGSIIVQGATYQDLEFLISNKTGRPTGVLVTQTNPDGTQEARVLSELTKAQVESLYEIQQIQSFLLEQLGSVEVQPEMVEQLNDAIAAQLENELALESESIAIEEQSTGQPVEGVILEVMPEDYDTQDDVELIVAYAKDVANNDPSLSQESTNDVLDEIIVPKVEKLNKKQKDELRKELQQVPESAQFAEAINIPPTEEAGVVQVGSEPDTGGSKRARATRKGTKSKRGLSTETQANNDGLTQPQAKESEQPEQQPEQRLEKPAPTRKGRRKTKKSEQDKAEVAVNQPTTPEPTDTNREPNLQKELPSDIPSWKSGFYRTMAEEGVPLPTHVGAISPENASVNLISEEQEVTVRENVNESLANMEVEEMVLIVSDAVVKDVDAPDKSGVVSSFSRSIKKTFIALRDAVTTSESLDLIADAQDEVMDFLDSQKDNPDASMQSINLRLSEIISPMISSLLATLDSADAVAFAYDVMGSPNTVGLMDLESDLLEQFGLRLSVSRNDAGGFDVDVVRVQDVETSISDYEDMRLMIADLRDASADSLTIKDVNGVTTFQGVEVPEVASLYVKIANRLESVILNEAPAQVAVSTRLTKTDTGVSVSGDKVAVDPSARVFDVLNTYLARNPDSMMPDTDMLNALAQMGVTPTSEEAAEILRKNGNKALADEFAGRNVKLKREQVIRRMIASKFRDFLVNSGVPVNEASAIVDALFSREYNSFAKKGQGANNFKEIRETVADVVELVNDVTSIFTKSSNIKLTKAGSALYRILNDSLLGDVFLATITDIISKSQDMKQRVADAYFAGVPVGEDIELVKKQMLDMGFGLPSVKNAMAKEVKDTTTQSPAIPITEPQPESEVKSKKREGSKTTSDAAKKSRRKPTTDKVFRLQGVTRNEQPANLKFDTKQQQLFAWDGKQYVPIERATFLKIDGAVADKSSLADLQAEAITSFGADFSQEVDDIQDLDDAISMDSLSFSTKTKPGTRAKGARTATPIGLPGWQPEYPGVNEQVKTPRQIVGFFAAGLNALIKKHPSAFSNFRQSLPLFRVTEEVSGVTFMGAYDNKQRSIFISRAGKRIDDQPYVFVHEIGHWLDRTISDLRQAGNKNIKFSLGSAKYRQALLMYAKMDRASDPPAGLNPQQELKYMLMEGFANYLLARMKNPDFVATQTAELHEAVNKALDAAFGKKGGADFRRLIDDEAGSMLRKFHSATNSQQIAANTTNVGDIATNTIGNMVRRTLLDVRSIKNLGPAIRQAFNGGFLRYFRNMPIAALYDGTSYHNRLIRQQAIANNARITKNGIEIEPYDLNDYETAAILVRAVNAQLEDVANGFILNSRGEPMRDRQTGAALNMAYIENAFAAMGGDGLSRMRTNTQVLAKVESTLDYFRNIAVGNSVSRAMRIIQEIDRARMIRGNKTANSKAAIIEALTSDADTPFQRLSPQKLDAMVDDMFNNAPESRASYLVNILEQVSSVNPMSVLDFSGTKPSVDVSAISSLYPSISVYAAEILRKGLDPYSKESFAYLLKANKNGEYTGERIALTGLTDSTRSDYEVWAETAGEYMDLTNKANRYLSQNPEASLVKIKGVSYRVVFDSQLNITSVIDENGNRADSGTATKAIQVLMLRLMYGGARLPGSNQVTRDFVEYIMSKEVLRRYREVALAHFTYMKEQGIVSQEKYDGALRKNPSYIAMHRLKATTMAVDGMPESTWFDPFDLYDKQDFFVSRDEKVMRMADSKLIVRSDDKEVLAGKTGGQGVTNDIFTNLMAMIDTGRKMVARNNYMRSIESVDLLTIEVNQAMNAGKPDPNSLFLESLPEGANIPQDMETITIYRDGQPRRYRIRNQETLSAFINIFYGRYLKNKINPAMGGVDVVGSFLSFGRKLSELFKWSITVFPAKALGFAFNNKVRDMANRAMSSKHYSVLPTGVRIKLFEYIPIANPLFWVDEVMGFVESLKNGDLNKMYQARGGRQLSPYYSSPDSYAKIQKQIADENTRDVIMSLSEVQDLSEWLDTVRKAGVAGQSVKSTNRGYMKFLQSFELSTRLSEYRAALRNYRSMKDSKGNRIYTDEEASLAAMKDARGLMDFSVGSTFIKTINMYVPFLNAAMQGQYRFWNLMNEDFKSLRRLELPGYTIRAGMLFLLAEMLMRSAMSDEEEAEYDGFDTRTKDMFWMYKTGPDQWLRIPKPFDFAVQGNSMWRLYEQFVNNNQDVNWTSLINANLEGSTPLYFAMNNGEISINAPLKLFPPAVKRMFEVATNRDLYYGGNVIPEYEGYGMDYDILKDQGQFDQSTFLAKMLGEITGGDPRGIDFFMGGLVPNVVTGTENVVRVFTDSSPAERQMGKNDLEELAQALRFTVSTPFKYNRYSEEISDIANAIGSMPSDNPDYLATSLVISTMEREHNEIRRGYQSEFNDPSLTPEARDLLAREFIFEAKIRRDSIREIYNDYKQRISNPGR